MLGLQAMSLQDGENPDLPDVPSRMKGLWFMPVEMSAGVVRWKSKADDDTEWTLCSIVDKSGRIELTIGDQSTELGSQLIDELFYMFARHSSSWDAAARTLVDEVRSREDTQESH